MPTQITSHLVSRGLRALVGDRWDLPYALAPSGARLRLAFIGQSTYFQACALADECSEIETSFVDFRAGADPRPMIAALASFDPHVVLAFRPEIVPAEAFDALERAATVGFLTEPLPRRGDGNTPTSTAASAT